MLLPKDATISAAVPVTVAAAVAVMVPLVLTAAIADNVPAAILPLSLTVIASFPRPLTPPDVYRVLMEESVLLLIVVTFAASTSTVVMPFIVLRSAADTVLSPVPIVIVKALFPFASTRVVKALTAELATVPVTTPVV